MNLTHSNRHSIDAKAKPASLPKFIPLGVDLQSQLGFKHIAANCHSKKAVTKRVIARMRSFFLLFAVMWNLPFVQDAGKVPVESTRKFTHTRYVP
jgi:hypothetical protein